MVSGSGRLSQRSLGGRRVQTVTRLQNQNVRKGTTFTIRRDRRQRSSFPSLRNSPSLRLRHPQELACGGTLLPLRPSPSKTECIGIRLQTRNRNLTWTSTDLGTDLGTETKADIGKQAGIGNQAGIENVALLASPVLRPNTRNPGNVKRAQTSNSANQRIGPSTAQLVTAKRKGVLLVGHYGNNCAKTAKSSKL